jgi:hypothetical protein
LLKAFVPDLYLDSIYDINLKKLRDDGLNGIIVDLDNTLVESTQPHATEKLNDRLKKVKKSNFKVMIVSNNTKLRVSKFSKPLDIPYIHTAKKPLNRAFKKALRTLEAEPHETIVIGDQLLTDVLGGNRMGLYIVLVVPISDRDNIFTRFNRRIERFIFRRLEKKDLLTRG